MDDAEKGLARQRPRLARGPRACLAALLPLLLTACASERERPVWFCPDVGGRDMLRLFSDGDDWGEARE